MNHELESDEIELLREEIRILSELLAVVEDTAVKQSARLELALSKAQELQERHRHEAIHDELTGLENRRAFLERLNWCVARIDRNESYLFAVAFVDLDRFKNVNDSLGHELGDELLKGVANRIKKSLRSVDTLARFGGDEFTILIDDISDVSDAIRVTDRILDQLSTPFLLDGHEIFSGASIGLALATPECSSEVLLRDADTALYRAKEKGRGQAIIFDEEMHELVKKALQLESDIKAALADGQFRMVFQPICAIDSRRVTSFEALIRWNHPTAGAISPADFIPVAEDIGFIQQIGAWVMQQSCAALARWRKTIPNTEDIKINVNVSLKQIVVEGFVKMVQRALEDSGLPGNALNIEVTEGVFLKEPVLIRKVFGELNSMGIGIHLDDFGTGYSSLTYLREFPIEILKIDQSFIRNIHVNVRDLEIARAIVALGGAFGLGVIAEGIETEEQLLFLRGLQCAYGQGYLFARPMEEESISEFILSQSIRSS